MKNFNQLLQELLAAYRNHKILLFPPWPAPTLGPTPSIIPQPQGQNGDGFFKKLRNSFSPKPQRSKLASPPPPRSPSPPFDSQKFAIDFGNEFTALLIFILKINEGDIFYIPNDLGREPTIPKIPAFTNSSLHSKSASSIKDALHKYEYRQMYPYMNNVTGQELTP